MEAVFQTDSSFFNIILSNGTNITNDVINFEIIESIGEITRGNISLYDPYHIYSSQYLPTGTEFFLQWGYKKRNESIDILLNNPLEMTTTGQRKGLRSVIISPSGSGTNNGAVTYNCSFYAYEFLSQLQNIKVFDVGTKGTVIQQVLLNMNIASSVIDFKIQNEKLTSNTYVRQNESDFAFLVRLAYEWRCIFKLGYTEAGLLTALFVDNEKISDQKTISWVRSTNGAIVGSNKKLEYGIGTMANTISYSWSKNVGESGQGDGVNLQIINGETIITRTVVEDQAVKTLKLNQNRLKKFIEEHSENTEDITKQVFSATNLASRIGNTTVRYFFDEIESKTAPQGYGYSIQCEMIGDVTLAPPVEIRFGDGFPSELQDGNQGLTSFYIKTATHTLNADGYRTVIDIGDNVNITSSFIRG
jgi:hypothetical protein